MLLFSFNLTMVSSKIAVSQISNEQWILLGLWIIHYFNRAVVSTFRTPSMKPSPFVIMLMAIFFNVVNGYINGYSMATMTAQDFKRETFMAGIAIFFLGMFGNIISDNKLMNLRKNQGGPVTRSTEQGKPGQYFIPNGWLFDYVACPNYFCEIVEWTGFAIATNLQIAPCLFVLMTIANLLPRAVSTRRWYSEYFKSKYPASRKALIPFIL